MASKTYKWSGVDSSGARVKGKRVVAANEGAAVAALRREGYLPTSMTEISSGGLNMEIGPTGVKWKWKHKAEFSRRLYQMLRAGISLPASLQSMAEDAKPPVAKMLNEIAENVSSGRPLYQALADHPRAFDDVFIAYVETAEESGELEETMRRLSVLMAKRAAMHTKIKAVLAYPKMVGGTIAILVVGIILFLVPTFAKIYDTFGAELPAPTRGLVWVSEHMMPVSFHKIDDPIPFIVPVPEFFNISSFFIYIAVAWIVFRRKTAGDLEVGKKLDQIRYKVPAMGKLWHTSGLFQWASTLAGALAAGVTTTRALELAAASSGSSWQLLATKSFVEAVRSGRQINQVMAEEPDLYPPAVRTMVATGEATGDVDVMLQAVANTMDEELDALVSGLSAKIEVLLLIVLGVVVGGLLVVLYMPILNLAASAADSNGL